MPEIKILKWDRFVKDGNDMLSELAIQPGELDLYTAGAPCPPFSGENSRKSLNDPRIRLTLDLPITISQLRPKCFVLESVPGLLNHEAWGELQRRLDKLTDYNWNVRLLWANHYGCPSERLRLIIIGIRKDVSLSVQFPSPTSINDPSLRIKNITPHILYVCGGRAQLAMKMKNADGFMPTITATRNIMVVTVDGVKRWLTIPEVLLFSGFPEDWKFAPNRFGKDSVLLNWKRIGNAVPPPLAKQIALTLRHVLAQYYFKQL